jgi:UDP-N-acetylglucosamine--dolichyl-phosphate N-acetylglucosaminephosphotransferase
MLIYLVALLLISFLVSFIFTGILIPRLKRFRIVGKDMNKEGKPEVAEMGGIAIVAGFTAGVLLAVFGNSFFGFNFNLVYVLAALITVHSIAFIGIVDDLLDVPQWLKAFLPIFSSVPLVAAKATASTIITIPFIGMVDFGIFYILVLIPIGVTVASNLTNMLAGFNGLEAGMGVVIFGTVSLFAYLTGNVIALVVFLPMLGALLGFIPYNWYPAKVFPGDVGTLSIGAALAAGVIIGNMEGIGALLLSLHVIDFFIKLANGFPSSNWWGNYKDGKLYPPEERVIGFCQLLMKLTNGISERNLVIVFILAETAVAIMALLFYWPK